MENPAPVFEWIMGGGILGILTFSIATYVRADKQIDRVYQRLDEKTEKLKGETVNKDICGIVHKNVDTALQEVKKAVECVPKIKAGIDMLLQKNGLKNND